MSEDKETPGRESAGRDHLLDENRKLAQRYLELESTTRRQLEKLRNANAALIRGEANMRTLLENAAIGFALLDPNQRIVSINQTLCSLIGRAQPELPGESFNTLVYVGSLQAFTRLLGGPGGRESASGVVELISHDGTLVPCRLAVSDWVDESGTVKGVFVLAFSVEEEKRARSRLKEMEEALAEREKSRKLFLDVMSRELRTPASGIMGMIRMLMDAHLDERQAELAGVIHSSASSIVRLVDDMVDIVRLDAADQTLRPAPFRPVELVQGTANLFGVRAEEKGLEIKLAVSPMVPEWIAGDSLRIRRVLAHFLDNALKFTEKGHITLSVDVIGETVRFMVTDTGPGLPSPDADPFAAVTPDSPSTRRHGGIGIGLPISRRLVQLMGGKIGYESEPGRGSEFHFTVPFVLPDKGADTGEKYEPPPEAMRLAPLHILLADGNVLGRRVVRAFLQFDGHSLTQVDNGLDAAEKCRFNSFDIVLLDANLPKLDGLQTLRLIREDEKTTGRRRVPVLVFAAGDGGKDTEFYRRAGADGVLKKPIQPVELMAAMSEAAGVKPLAVSRPTAPGQYNAMASGGALRRIDGSQIVNLRQVMLDDQFMGILRFFMEDAVPGLIALHDTAEGKEPDRERIAFSASKARGLAGYLGFSALSDLLNRVETACRDKAEPEALRALTRELPMITDDTLEELKRILPEAFSTISAMSGPVAEAEHE